MEQKKILYMGIDLTDEQAMVSLFGRGMEEPETIMTGASKERYGIPVAMYLADSGHIFYGEEALRRKENPQGDFFDHLYQRALDETESESKFYQGLLRQFVQRLIQLKDRYRFDAQELCVCITVPEITKQVVTVFQWMCKELGLFGEQFFLMDHGESFFGHTYHQEALLWQHDVALFDFSSEHVTFYLLHRRHGAKIQIVTAEKKMWNVPAYVHQDASVKDEFFANIIREAFASHMISAVYFVGDGFDGDWLKESLRVLGGNKRVFLGKNLFTKGACYAGYRYTDASFWGFFYNCDYKMQGEIRMQVQCGEENIEIRLVEAGKNWFASMPEYVLLYDGTPELSVTIGEIGQIHAQTRVFPLTDLPDRPEKTLRFRIWALAENGRKVVLHLEDDGFGELFESSGKVWEFPVTFEPEEKRSLYDRKYRKNS